jgi:excisionase family DNA binding protein
MNTPATIDGRFLSYRTASQYLDVSPATLRRMVAEGRINPYRIGGRLVRFDRQELDQVFRASADTPRGTTAD